MDVNIEKLATMSPSEVFETYMVPAIFAPWTDALLDLTQLQANDRLLDVACGTGIVARTAYQRMGDSGRVVGLDFNAGQLEVARNIETAIEWREGNATDLPFSDEEFNAPVAVVGLESGVVAVSSGRDHTCVVMAGGVQCWGTNIQGRLGTDFQQRASSEPVHVVGLSGDPVAVYASDFHTCAVTATGGLDCWGSNSAGQLGDGTTKSRFAPSVVLGLAGKVTAVATGGKHTCARIEDGGIQCWGDNAQGQLGDGTSSNRGALWQRSGYRKDSSAYRGSEPVNIPSSMKECQAASSSTLTTTLAEPPIPQAVASWRKRPRILHRQGQKGEPFPDWATPSAPSPPE